MRTTGKGPEVQSWRTVGRYPALCRIGLALDLTLDLVGACANAIAGGPSKKQIAVSVDHFIESTPDARLLTFIVCTGLGIERVSVLFAISRTKK